MQRLEHFFKKYVFIHTHIEKCGGSTLSHYLTTLLGEKHVLDLRPFPSELPLKILRDHPDIRKKIPDIQALSGHIWYDNPWQRLFFRYAWCHHLFSRSLRVIPCKKPLYIASIRHPIDRLASLFRYIKTRPDHRLYPQIEHNNFNQFIESLIKNNSFRVQNEMCCLFAGKRAPHSTYTNAKYSFEHHYFAVTPYNKTHELANIIADVFTLPRVEPTIINSSELTEPVEIDESTRAILQEKCYEDIQLYDYMLKNYEEKLTQAKVKLEKIVRTHT